MKVRKNGSWEQIRKTSKLHKLEVVGTHIAVIVAVFVVAAVMQFI